MKKFTLPILMSIFLFSCNSKTEKQDLNDPNAISFAAPIANVTKTTLDPNGVATSWKSGDAIGVFCDQASSSGITANAQNSQYTTTDGSTFSSLAPLYWKNGSDTHKFCAYYPWVNGSTAAAAILPDLSNQSAGEFSSYDFLISPQTAGTTKNEGIVTLSDFTHAFVMFEFNITKDISLPSEITISSITLAATDIATTGDCKINLLAAGNDITGTKAASITGKGGAIGSGVTIRVIALAGTYQPTIAINSDVINIAATNLEASPKAYDVNTRYVYNVNLKLTKAEITAGKITDWGNGTGGTIEPGI